MTAASCGLDLVRRAAALAALASVIASAGCDSEPIKDERPNRILSACCEASRERVELAQDVETSKYRDRCGSCRVGKSKGDCEAAARRVMVAVAKAYAADLLPSECSTMREQLGGFGITIPASP
jgi:hypothetical protein